MGHNKSVLCISGVASRASFSPTQTLTSAVEGQMKIVAYTFLLFLLSLFLCCGKGQNASSPPVNQRQQNAVSLSGKTENPISHVRKGLLQKDDLAAAIAGVKKRIRLGLTWAWGPPAQTRNGFPIS